MLTETRSLVCVIDDDAMVRESICLLLDMLGLQCTAFADCRSFLDSPTLPHCVAVVEYSSKIETRHGHGFMMGLKMSFRGG